VIGANLVFARTWNAKVRIAENIAKKVEKNIYLIYNSILKP
jgi:hypothetical protein